MEDKITIQKWVDSFKKQFNTREYEYKRVYTAMIHLQLKDDETEEICLHNIEYKSKEAIKILGEL